MTASSPPSPKAPAVKEVRLGPGQMRALNSPARFIALVAGIQSGKTYTGANWMNQQVDLYPNDDHLIIASSYKVLWQATITKFKELAPKGWYRLHKSPEELYFEILPNKRGRSGKGRIWLRSAENSNKIEGMTLRSVWADEAGDFPELTWTNLQGRLSIKQGKMLMTSTPYAWNWLKKFEEDWKADTDNGTKPGTLSYDYINYPSYDNPYFPMEEYERAQKTMAPHEFERRYLGLFTRPEGLIYGNFDREAMVLSQSAFQNLIAHDPLSEVIAGIDWGYNDPTALVVLGITRGGKYILLDEYRETKQEVGDLVAVAKGVVAKWEVSKLYADSENPQLIRAFNSGGVTTYPVRKLKGQNGGTYIKEGIAKIRQLISEHRYFILDSCPQSIREKGLYRYKSKLLNGMTVMVDEPHSADSHLSDAERYAIDSHWVEVTEAVAAVKEETLIDRILARVEERHEAAQSESLLGITMEDSWVGY